MVFDHVTLMIAPWEENWMLDLLKCLAGSKVSQEGARRLDFRKNEKKPTKHAAQKHVCFGWVKFKI
jgi:hypothetical protein